MESLKKRCMATSLECPKQIFTCCAQVWICTAKCWTQTSKAKSTKNAKTCQNIDACLAGLLIKFCGCQNFPKYQKSSLYKSETNTPALVVNPRAIGNLGALAPAGNRFRWSVNCMSSRRGDSFLSDNAFFGRRHRRVKFFPSIKFPTLPGYSKSHQR